MRKTVFAVEADAHLHQTSHPTLGLDLPRASFHSVYGICVSCFRLCCSLSEERLEGFYIRSHTLPRVGKTL